MDLLWLLPLAYLAGSIPTAYLIGKWAGGLDIRRQGSGNPGATNVARLLGWRWGAATLVVDTLKGALPVLAARQVAATELAAVLSGMAAMAGHIWTPWLRFKGGRGVATGLGVFLVLLPLPTLAATGMALAGAAVTRYMSVGSGIGAIALPVFCLLGKAPVPYTAAAVGMGLLILWRHTDNFRRIFAGTEHRLSFRRR